MPAAGPIHRLHVFLGQLTRAGLHRSNPPAARKRCFLRVGEDPLEASGTNLPLLSGNCPSHAHIPVADSDSIHARQHGRTGRARSHPLVNQQIIERAEHQTSGYHFAEVAVILMCLHNSIFGMVRHALQDMRDFMASIPGKPASMGDTKHPSGNGKQRISPLRIMARGSAPEHSSAPAEERRGLRLRKLGC